MAESLYYENPVTDLPLLFVWPFSGCNCRCVMCDIWKDKSRQVITADEVRQSVTEWRALGVRTVVLTGGEAILNSEIWDIAEVLVEHGITIQLISTGVTLWKHADNVLRYCADVTFSLDGPRAAHNEIRRVPLASELLERSVRALHERDPNFPTRARCAVHRRNFRLLPETVRFAQELGLDKVSFIAADVSSEAFNRPGGWDVERQEDVGLGVDDLGTLSAELDRLERECTEQFASGYITKSPAVIRRKLLDYYRALHGAGAFPHFDCNAPWKSAVIEPDGTVRPCFFHEAYGNVREVGSLERVINSSAAIKFRQELDVRTDPICQRCVCRFAIEGCNCTVHRVDA